MDLIQIRELVAEELVAIDRVIGETLRSDVELINQLSYYLINSGGKRLRPLLVVLAAKVCQYTGYRHVNLAVIIEFIHTATLLHDDVVDGSELRRGAKTANVIWGNEASVLVGDFLYSRAFQMMVEIGYFEVMALMASTTNRIAEGEVMQLLNCHNPDISIERYQKVIEAKTAVLFQAAGKLGGLIAGASEEVVTALGLYGLHLGVAFQLVDDALDYHASTEVLGKNVGDDLNEGKPTMPLIYALQTGTPAQVAMLRQAIEHPDQADLTQVLKTIESVDAITYTMQSAVRETDKAKQALEGLPETPFRQALISLAEFAVERCY